MPFIGANRVSVQYLGNLLQQKGATVRLDDSQFDTSRFRAIYLNPNTNFYVAVHKIDGGMLEVHYFAGKCPCEGAK